MRTENKKCKLCGANAKKQEFLYFRCSTCDLVFKQDSALVSCDREKSRYETHQNILEDKNYLAYLKKLLDFTKDFEGPVLDFGCGPTKGLEHLLKKRSLDVESFDPFFFPKLKDKTYNFIYSSECFEHFRNPKESLGLIVSLLRLGGKLAISTQFHNEDTKWSSWWYARDYTHIVFYSKSTFKWIEKNYPLKLLRLSSPHVVFEKV